MNKKSQILTLTSIITVAIFLSFVAVAAKPGGGGSGGGGGAKACADGIDNDNDGLIDLNDPGCSNRKDNSETSPSLVCDNGIDENDDADSLADFRLSGGDPGCTSATDTSEIDGECDDKTDNDGDTYTDYPDDPGCTDYSDSSELGTVQCDDGIDNGDSDNLVDYPDDLGCSSPSDNDEIDGQCDDTIDNDDADSLIDYPNDLGCTSYNDASEIDGQCDDGIDNNDLDTIADYPNDLGCSSYSDDDETSLCEDSIDNDGDTHTDLDDSECTSYTDNDENPKDSCTDTDSGIDEYTIGTVSGDDDDAPFSHTDFCIDSTTVNEYYCGTINEDYDPLSTSISCPASEECSGGKCVPIQDPPAEVDITVINNILGQTTKYLGVTEGAQFVIEDIVNLGAKSYRIWYGTDRFMNNGSDYYEDFVEPYGDPSIEDIKAKLVNWPAHKQELEDLINITKIDQKMKTDLWWQANGEGSFDAQMINLTNNNILPVISLRNKDKGGTPINAPPKDGFPFTENDWNEYYYYVFAVTYWTNVYANGGNGYNVQHWEVHNEPSRDFNGTKEEYVEFVNYTYDAITNANDLANITTKMMAAVDTTDLDGWEYLNHTVDNENNWGYFVTYTDYHNYMRYGDDVHAANDIFPIGNNKTLWQSEWGAFESDDLEWNYTEFSMGLKVANTTFRLSQLQKDGNSDKYLEGSNLFVMDGPWGPYIGLVNNGIKTPTYHGFHLQTRCIQDGKNFYELSKDDNFVLVAKEDSIVYISSVNYGKTFTINITNLEKVGGTYDLYIFNETHQDVLIDDNKAYSDGVLELTVPNEGAICAVVN